MRKLISTLVTVGLIVGTTALSSSAATADEIDIVGPTVALDTSPVLVANDSPSGSSTCVDIAQRALENAEVTETPNGSAEFACLGDQVVVTANSGTEEELRVNVGIQYSDQTTETSPTDASQPTLEVPFTSTAAANDFCDYGGYDREVVSELQDDTWGCLLYGEYNQSTGAIIWQRHIEYEWNMYAGWPSAQNKLRTIPSTGSPKMTGTFTSFKQNGWWAPPTSLASSTFTNVGNTATEGWVVGQLDEDGQFSVGMGDINIVDTQKGYNQYFEGTIHSHRFTCQSSNQRCFYPNGEEAPL
ncbi:hypothetical protein RZO50_14510 [Microbacterium sp. SSW1-59]|uniref:hypothetical protein n=1 Tax=Microbacterium xanthum TaxID=3079794 RepID=UPI002AD59AE5|nr:hypothetical protein [Microbacterium sp. SSW1-59]MDZ8202730.1 hypothetical protein [Microbacterium sp. SSW1-59]